MTDFDDGVRKRYRELEAPEPPAALDQAILASAQRAVARRRTHWAMPISAAAVLVLAVGVTLRMQQEKPGIESSMPSGSPPDEYSAPTPPVADALQTAPAPAPEAKRAVPSPAAKERATVAPPPAPPAVKVERQLEETPVQAKKEKADRNQVAPQEARAPAPEPKAFSEAPVVADKPQRMEQPALAAAPSARVAAPAAPAAAPPAAAMNDARRDAATAESDAQRNKQATVAAGASAQKLAKEALDPREKELERIAQLRRDGRHADADEALRIFKRDNPDYRIPDAVWEQIKPR